MSINGHSANITMKVANSSSEFWLLQKSQVIIGFHLQVWHWKNENDSRIGKEIKIISSPPNDVYLMTFSVTDLEPSTSYKGYVICYGADINITSASFSLKTLPELRIPVIYSSQPNIIAIGETVKLTCSSEAKTKIFRWFKSSRLLDGETLSQLKISGNETANDVYFCHTVDIYRRLATSNGYKLKVVEPGNIHEYKTSVKILLQNNWIDELQNPSSVEFFSWKIYVQLLVKHIMMDWPSFVRSEVKSFSPGSIVAVVDVTDRVEQSGDTSNISTFLNEQVKFGAVDSFNSEDFNLELDGITLDSSDSSVIPEEQPVGINCQFTIIHSADPEFDLIWIYNGSVINQKTARTFSFVKKPPVVNQLWGSMKVYNYSFQLKIQAFEIRLRGEFTCRIDIKMSNLSFDIISMEKEQSLTITYGQVFKIPTVAIYPQSIQVQASNQVTVYCNHTHSMSVWMEDNSQNDVGHLLTNSHGISSFSIELTNTNKKVRCVAESYQGKTNQISKSDYCDIRIIQNDSVLCPENMDKQSIKWETSMAGTTITKNCPSGYTGVVTRACFNDGIWEESNYIQCKKEALESIEEQIKNINNDGTGATDIQIKNISVSVNESITDHGPILSGDIVAVVNILHEVGKAVTDVEGDHKKDVVDSDTLKNFATAANAVLSTDDAEWETVTKVESDRTNAEKDADTGYRLVMAMDDIVTSSLSNTMSNEPIVKKNIAIKRDQFKQEDILFPNQTENQYKTFDSWVLNSNKAFLSAQNLVKFKDGLQYAVVLFNNMEAKFRVDSEEQKKYKDSKSLQDQQLSSDIISFSLSKNISSFQFPLHLEFQMTKENFSSPACVFLDTSLGSLPVWSTRGCETRRDEVRSDLVKCQCNHLTNFAILMSPSGTAVRQHHEILTIVTYVGCGLSLLCLIITIIMHAVTWKYLKENRAVLHVHLSVVLILGYITFLAGINQTDSDIACTVVAALLHFLFLTVFFIMLAEGIYIFWSIAFVFSKKSHMWKLLLMAYGCPILIVAICLGISKTDGYRSSEFCWLSVDTGYLWAFVGPALFVIVVNFIILIVTLRTMMTTTAMKKQDAKAKTKAGVRAIFILTPIFGITWVFGVFSVNETTVAFQYVFAIFNALQGFFVFLFYCLFSSQIKDGLGHMTRRFRSRSMFESSERVVSTSSKQSSESNASKNVSGVSSGPSSPTTELTDVRSGSYIKRQSFKFGFPSTEYKYVGPLPHNNN